MGCGGSKESSGQEPAQTQQKPAEPAAEEKPADQPAGQFVEN